MVRENEMREFAQPDQQANGQNEYRANRQRLQSYEEINSALIVN